MRLHSKRLLSNLVFSVLLNIKKIVSDLTKTHATSCRPTKTARRQATIVAMKVRLGPTAPAIQSELFPSLLDRHNG